MIRDKVIIFFGVAAVVGGCVFFGLRDIDKNKEYKNKVEDKIAEDLKLKSTKINKFKMEAIDRDENEKDDYFFTFTGSAVNTNGKTVDYFSAKYNINKELYDKVEIYLDEHPSANLNANNSLYKLILDAIENANLIEKQRSDYVEGIKATVLSVTKPNINNNTVSYCVEYMFPIQNEKGDINLILKRDKFSFEMDKNLISKPESVYLLNSKMAKIENIKKSNITIRQNDIINFNNSNINSNNV